MEMAQRLEEMPLFPLNTVLFPYAEVQLHVFEDRYRELVHDCLSEDRPFGVVLIRSGSEVGGPAEPYLVGTAVRILKVETYDDGRMDIRVKGERRFRIRQLDESGAYLTGYVEPVVEHPVEGGPWAEEVIHRAREEGAMFIQRMFARQQFKVQVVFPEDPMEFSFTLANLIPMEDLDKQRMLETTDTLERVQDLLPIIEQQLMEEIPDPSTYRLTAHDLKEWILPN